MKIKLYQFWSGMIVIETWHGDFGDVIEITDDRKWMRRRSSGKMEIKSLRLLRVEAKRQWKELYE